VGIRREDKMLNTAARNLERIDLGLLADGAIGGLLGGLLLFLFMGGYYRANQVGFTSMLSFCFAGFVYSTSSSGMGQMAGSHSSMPMTGSETTMAGSHSSMPMTGSATTIAGAHSSMPMTGSATTMAGAHSSMPMTGSASSMAGGHAMGATHAVVASHGMGTMMGSAPASHLAVGAILHTAMSATAGVAFAVALAVLIRAGFGLLATPVGYVLGGAAGGALLYVIMMYAVAPALNTNISDFTPRGPFFIAHLVYGATVAAFVYWRRHHAVVSASGPLAAQPA
jgi:hypothetical protein